MAGGPGNDTYFVDNAGDSVIELPTEGVDTIRSTISLTIPENVEHLTLTTNAATHGTGNALSNRIIGFNSNNTLIGGGANDSLKGKLGNDTLTGNGGRDRFYFDTALGAGNVDTITDFDVAADFIYLDNAVFSTLAVGPLPATALQVGASATTAAHRIVYDPANGALSYDSNGSAAGGSTQFATLPTGLALTAANCVVN